MVFLLGHVRTHNPCAMSLHASPLHHGMSFNVRKMKMMIVEKERRYGKILYLTETVTKGRGLNSCDDVN